MRSLLALLIAAGATVAVPALAQDTATPAGRFQLTPGGGNSFVRLDTRTGTVTHCRQDESGVWRCEPILDSGLAQRLDALSAKVDRLSLRVDALAGQTPIPPGQALPQENPAQPRGLARAAIDRLLEMIREIKHHGADATS
jgi:hypothetical protein